MSTRRQLVHITRWVGGLALLAGSALIAHASLEYFDPDVLPGFVIEKLPVRFEALWLASLKVHVVAALFSLPACVALSSGLVTRRAQLHRWLGRVTGAVVLLALVPSGVVLAFDAKGGGWVTLGFLVSAALVVWGMTSGIVLARRRDFVGHTRAVWHVLGQLSVAVTSRAMLLGLEAAAVDPEVAYVVALWLPVLATAAFVELVAPRRTLPERTPLEDLRALAPRRLVPAVVARAGR